jgi:uncharacterized membrane protein YbhN (UPF0104 family)
MWQHWWILLIFAALLLTSPHIMIKGIRKMPCLAPLIPHMPQGRKIRSLIKDFWSEFFEAYGTIAHTGKSRFLLTMFLTGIQWVCYFSVLIVLARRLLFKCAP